MSQLWPKELGSPGSPPGPRRASPARESCGQLSRLTWESWGAGRPPALTRPESALTCQVNENARKDLKEGLLLYNSENNVGLKNAWNIIQAEVRGRAGRGGVLGAGAGPGLRLWDPVGHPGLLGQTPCGSRRGVRGSGRTASRAWTWPAAAGPGELGRTDDREGTSSKPFLSEALARTTAYFSSRVASLVMTQEVLF